MNKEYLTNLVKYYSNIKNNLLLENCMYYLNIIYHEHDVM